MRRPLRKNKTAKKPELDKRVLPIIEAIDAAREVFDQESTALEEGGLGVLDEFFDKKKDLEKRIKLATTDAVASGLSLNGDSLEVKAVEDALNKMGEAATRNAASLQSARNALDHINNLIRRSASESGSEGMYNHLAKKVDAREKTIVGFGASI